MAARNSTYEHITDVEDPLRSAEMSVDGPLLDTESPPPYITFRKGMSCGCREELLSFQASMKTMLEAYMVKEGEKLSLLLSKFEDIQSSIKFLSDKYDSIELKMNDVAARVCKLEKQVSSPQGAEQRIALLERRLESAEQKSRSCNIEISNLPEKRGENLMSIVENISSLIKQPVSTRDVISIHRVPLMNPKSSRPRNIVVKLASQVLRDNFIAAARLKKGITSEELKLSGHAHKIYINEHLTLENKKLFRQAKETAKRNGHRFVWIKHGIILVRADIPEAVFSIRSEGDISKIKPYKATG